MFVLEGERLIRESEKVTVILFLLILGFGIFLRFHNLGVPSLETDEISGALISHLSSSEIASRNIYPEKSDIPVEEPFLPYLLMHSSLMTRDSDSMLRFPSALLGILTIIAIYILSNSWFNRSSALYSAFLLSFSFYHIFYSQLARGYAGLILFSILSMYFLYEFILKNSKHSLIGLILSDILGIYFHFAMLQVILIQFIILPIFTFFIKPSGFKTRDLLKAYFLIIMSVIIFTFPLSRTILSTMRGRMGGQTIDFELNHIYLANLLCRYGAGNGPAFFIYNVLFLLGVYRIFKERKEIFIILTIWIFIPFILLAYKGYQYFFHIRYIIYIFPVYIFVTAYGVSVLADNIISAVKAKNASVKIIIHTSLVIIFLTLNFTPLRLYYRMPAKMTDWKTIANFIALNYKKGKNIYIESSFCIRELGYYLNKINPDITINTFHGNVSDFKMICERSSDSIWYIDNNPVFDSLVMQYFNKRIIFGSNIFYELGRRELIDWDKSWFGPDNIRRYFPILYCND